MFSFAGEECIFVCSLIFLSTEETCSSIESSLDLVDSFFFVLLALPRKLPRRSLASSRSCSVVIGDSSEMSLGSSCGSVETRAFCSDESDFVKSEGVLDDVLVDGDLMGVVTDVLVLKVTKGDLT